MCGELSNNVPVMTDKCEKQLHMSKEITTKAKIFDLLVEIESHQVVINKLIEKKNILIGELNEIKKT